MPTEATIAQVYQVRLQERLGLNSIDHLLPGD
jgi:hypothetical protein